VIRKTDDGKAQWCQSDERVFSEFVQLVNNVPHEFIQLRSLCGTATLMISDYQERHVRQGGLPKKALRRSQSYAAAERRRRVSPAGLVVTSVTRVV
jgi:hypothetical protein